MAEYSFCVRSIKASLKEQSVFIECSMDVDSDTATLENIFLFTKKTHKALPIDIIVKKTIVQLKSRIWITPNEEYMLFIESDVKSITDENIEAALVRSITFKSDVTSEVKILSPINFEHVSNDLKIKFQETGKLVTNNYYLEVSPENAFYNLTYKTKLTCNGEKNVTECNLEPPSDGQYYIRVRAEDKDGNYGKWSETITFLYNAKTTESTIPSGADTKTPSSDVPNTSDGPRVVDLTPKTGADTTTPTPSTNDSISGASSAITIAGAETTTPTTTPTDTVSGAGTTTETTTDTQKMYCTLDSLKMLVDTFGIPDANMISYIKNASKEVDFLNSSTTTSTTDNSFAKEQYTRTRATIDCLTRYLMSRITSGGGAKFHLDTAEYEDSMNTTALKNLLGDLYKELQKWQDAMRGYYNEGRAKPKATRIGIKSSQNSDVSQITIDTILQDISRTSPQWS